MLGLSKALIIQIAALLLKAGMLEEGIRFGKSQRI